MNQQLLLLINSWAGDSAALDATMVFCAQQLIYVVFAIAALWGLYALKQRELKPLTCFLASLAVSFVLALIISHLYIEHRPFVTYQLVQLIPHEANQAFPSDHTLAASAIAFGFMFFTRLKKLGALLLAIAILIGFSRVFTGVHYPGDIAGAIVIALIGATLIHRCYRHTPLATIAR